MYMQKIDLIYMNCAPGVPGCASPVFFASPATLKAPFSGSWWPRASRPGKALLVACFRYVVCRLPCTLFEHRPQKASEIVRAVRSPQKLPLAPGHSPHEARRALQRGGTRVFHRVLSLPTVPSLQALISVQSNASEALRNDRGMTH